MLEFIKELAEIVKELNKLLPQLEKLLWKIVCIVSVANFLFYQFK